MTESDNHQQKKEWRERMYQTKIGILLATIEKHGDMALRQKAIDTVNTNWYTAAPDDFDWASDSREFVYHVLQAAVAAGVVHWSDREK